jgi:hypothetical protein
MDELLVSGLGNISHSQKRIGSRALLAFLDRQVMI